MIFIKEIGTIRRLDDLGRVVIPKSVREKLNMEQGDNIEFYVENETILLKKSSNFSVNEDLIYKLLQLYYLKYYKSSAIVEKDKILLEYGKDANKIKTLIENKNLESINKKVMVRINYNNEYFHITNILDKYHFIVYEDKMFTAGEGEILDFIVDYINKLLK